MYPLDGFDFFSAFSSILYVFQAFYFEISHNTYPVIPQPNCGKPSVKSSLYNSLKSNQERNDVIGRILAGNNAIQGSYPWTVSIRLKNYGYTHYCGGLLIYRCIKQKNLFCIYLNFVCSLKGALIYPQYILTSAHCVYNESVDEFIAAVGVHATNQLSQANLYDVERINIHPFYIDEDVFNDIAIVRLKYPVKFSDTVSTICLPTDKQFDAEILGQNLALSGW